jgi:hypothetical protein
MPARRTIQYTPKPTIAKALHPIDEEVNKIYFGELFWTYRNDSDSDNDYIVPDDTPLKYLIENSDIEFEYYSLSSMTTLTEEFIIKHMEEGWNYDELSDSIYISWAFIKYYKSKDWNWYKVSRRADVTIDVVLHNIELPWKQCAINRFIAKNPPPKPAPKPAPKAGQKYLSLILDSESSDSESNSLDSDLDTESDYKNISIESILKLPDNDWRNIIFRKDFTWDIVKNNYDLKWRWDYLSQRDDVSIAAIRSMPFAPWNWRHLTINKSVTLQMIKDNPDIPWVMEYISSNPNITPEIIKENPQIEWNYGLLSNSNMTFEFINENIDKGWDFENFEDLDISWTQIKPVFEQWRSINYYDILLKYRSELRAEMISKHFAIKRIVKWWRMVSRYDVSYKKAKENYEKAFQELTDI